MLSLVVLISGAGTNMAALIEATRADGFPAAITAVGADREAAGLAFAEAAGIPQFVVTPQPGQTRVEWAQILAATLTEWQPDLVVLSGLMRILPASFVDEFAPNLINTHPSLLPAHPGAHAVRDALTAQDAVTGATVHLVDSGVDSGPILAQRSVPIEAGDTEESLHARIKVVERELLIATVRGIADGSIDLAEHWARRTRPAIHPTTEFTSRSTSE